MKEIKKIEEVILYQTSDGKTFKSKQKAQEWEDKLSLKSYDVTLYFNGSYQIEIKAHNKEEAIKKALDGTIYEEDIDFDFVNGEAQEIGAE